MLGKVRVFYKKKKMEKGNDVASEMKWKQINLKKKKHFFIYAENIAHESSIVVFIALTFLFVFCYKKKNFQAIVVCLFVVSESQRIRWLGRL